MKPPPVPPNSLDDLIAAALHGDLTPEERAQFELRLQNDPNAQAAYQEAKAMHELLEKTNRSAQPDPDFEQRMVSGVRRKIAHPPHEETAWESLLLLWKTVTGAGKFVRLRWTEAVVLLGIVAVLLGVAFGPITNGIKSAKQNAQMQMAHALAVEDYSDQVDRGVPNPTMKDARQFLASDAEMAAKLKEYQTRDVADIMSAHAPANLEKALKEDGVTYSNANSDLTLSGTVAPNHAVIMNSSTTLDAGKTVVATNGSAPDINALPSLQQSATPVDQSIAMGGAFAANEQKQVAQNVPAAPAMPPPPAAMPSASTAAPLEAADSAQADAAASRSQRRALIVDADELESADKKTQEKLAKADLPAHSVVASFEKPQTQPNATTTATPASVDSRKLIRNAQLDLEVKSYQAAFDEVTALTRAAGGYVDTSNSQRGGNGKLQGILVVKILPENLDAFLLKLHDLGDVQNQSVSTDDVTKEYFDTQARLVNSQKMELQLQDLLKRENGKVSDLLAVERELGRVRGEIEQMQGQLKLYDFQVQYATVTMNVAEKDLNQTAAYLLKEQDDFALFATDVEATFQKARTAADDFKTQVLVANLQHNSGTDVSAELTVMVPPDQVEHFLTTIRGLGRVSNFTRQTQRIARDGGDSSQPADQTRTDKDKVQVHLVIKSDDDTRKQVAVVIVAKQVDDALDMAKAATLASTGAEILGSTLNTTPDGVSKAQLSVRVPGKEYTTLMDAFRALGRQASLNVQRNDNSGPGATGDDVPVIVSLSLTDQEVPVQATNLVVVTPKVDEMSQQIKRDAVAAGVEVKASNFGNQPNGSHLARLTLLLPMGKYPAYIETLKKLGRVQSLSVQRNDTSGNAADDAPAEIALALTDDDPPVQVTQMTLVASDVDTQAQQIKKQAGDAGVDIKSSSFERQPDGTELAQMTLRLPLGHYPAFLSTLQQAGKTESLSVQRDDHPEQARPDDSAPAEIQLQLHNTAAIVPDNSGLWPTLRDTFAQGFAALFGSVKVIGVIVAFLIPWVVAIVVLAWIGRRIYLWRKNR